MKGKRKERTANKIHKQLIPIVWEGKTESWYVGTSPHNFFIRQYYL